MGNRITEWMQLTQAELNDTGYNSAIWLGQARVKPWPAGASNARPMVTFPNARAVAYRVKPNPRITDFRIGLFEPSRFNSTPTSGEVWDVFAGTNANGIWYIYEAHRLKSLTGKQY